MTDFVIETTIERGVVNQERVSVDVTALPLAYLSLVCVDGPLERATRLQTLYVQPRRHAAQCWRRFSRIRIVVVFVHSAQRQLLRRRASSCARTDPPQRSPRGSLFRLFSLLALLTPSSM
jgi:hypothetical protein